MLLYREYSYTIFVCLLFFISCSDKNKETRELFVEKYSNENFRVFANKFIHIRGFGQNGNLIIFISNINAKKGCGPFIVILNPKSREVENTNRKLLDKGCVIDKKEMIALAKKFLNYKVGSLKVDENNNVYFNMREASRPDLVRFSNIKYKTKYYDDWTHLRQNWYFFDD